MSGIVTNTMAMLYKPVSVFYLSDVSRIYTLT